MDSFNKSALQLGYDILSRVMYLSNKATPNVSLPNYRPNVNPIVLRNMFVFGFNNQIII